MEKKDEYNYPIKYAVAELKERGGWAVNYSNYVIGYIASKCYVLEKIIEYKRNGDTEVKYKVVFPYKDIDSYEVGLRNDKKHLKKATEPVDNSYITDIVDNLYDTYEDAKKEAVRKNRYLEDDISLCLQFEKAVLKETKNMEITKDRPKVYVKED